MLQEIDDPDEVGLEAVGQLDRDGMGLQPIANLGDAGGGVGAHAVALVDEGDARDVVLVGLPPDGLGLGLDPADRAEHGDRAVEHAQAALDLDGEVDVPGGVDDVDPVVAPEAGGGGGGDGDAALLLLLHPVHDGRAVVDLAQTVRDARVEENSLSGRGLARVNMGHDADIAGLSYVHCAEPRLERISFSARTQQSERGLPRSPRREVRRPVVSAWAGREFSSSSRSE